MRRKLNGLERNVFIGFLCVRYSCGNWSNKWTTASIDTHTSSSANNDGFPHTLTTSMAIDFASSIEPFSRLIFFVLFSLGQTIGCHFVILYKCQRVSYQWSSLWIDSKNSSWNWHLQWKDYQVFRSKLDRSLSRSYDSIDSARTQLLSHLSFPLIPFFFFFIVIRANSYMNAVQFRNSAIVFDETSFLWPFQLWLFVISIFLSAPQLDLLFLFNRQWSTQQTYEPSVNLLSIRTNFPLRECGMCVALWLRTTHSAKDRKHRTFLLFLFTSATFLHFFSPHFHKSHTRLNAARVCEFRVWLLHCVCINIWLMEILFSGLVAGRCCVRRTRTREIILKTNRWSVNVNTHTKNEAILFFLYFDWG